VRDTAIGAVLSGLGQLISCFWDGGADYSEYETYMLPFGLKETNVFLMAEKQSMRLQ